MSLTKILSAVVKFVPNLVTHYTTVKPIEQSSELWAGVAAAVGAFAVHQGYLSADQWKAWGEPAIVYALARVFSKGLTVPSAPAA